MPESRKSRRSSSSRSRSHRSSSRDRRIRRYIFIGVIAVAVAGLVGLAGWYGLRVVRKQRALATAREFADRKEFVQAALAVRNALKISPNDLAANKLMAEMAEASQTREAVNWRKTVAGLQPGVAENYLKWAETALRFRDVAGAREALSKMDESSRNTAGYHDMAARLAGLTGQTNEIAAHVAAAAQLEPKNDSFQLQYAAVQLGSPVEEVRKGAVAKVEQLAASSKVRREALRMLIQFSLKEGKGPDALKYANQLMTGTGAVFEDRMLFLKLLGQMKRSEYWWFIAQLGAELPENDDDLVTLLSWMNNNGLARLTLNWSDVLPTERTERSPVCVAVAEAHALLGNWGKLKSLLRSEKWAELDFQRQALRARVAREEGDEGGAKSHWEAALAGAGERRDYLNALARFALTWKWDQEYMGVLWAIAKSKTQPETALRILLQKYTAQGQTRDILRVFSRMHELDEQNISVKNNKAYAQLLLNTDIDAAAMAAREAWDADPTSAEFVSTYAYSQYMKGKPEAAFKILRQVDERDRKIPSVALCFGVVMEANGMSKEAKPYLEAALAGRLLPEEKLLAERTLQKTLR